MDKKKVVRKKSANAVPSKKKPTVNNRKEETVKKHDFQRNEAEFNDWVMDDGDNDFEPEVEEKAEEIKLEVPEEEFRVNLSLLDEDDEEEEEEEIKPVEAKRVEKAVEIDDDYEDEEDDDDDDEIETIVIKRKEPSTNIQKKRKNAPSKAKKSSGGSNWRRFWIGLSIYAAVLLVLVIIFQIYTNGCLVKYENSQSVYKMQEYFKEFCEKANAGELPDNFQLPAGMTKGEFLSSLNGKALVYEKASDSYNSEKPVYVMKANGEEVARVKFEGVNDSVIFAILTVLDWNIVEAKAVGGNSTVEPTKPDVTPTPSETETETTTETETETEGPKTFEAIIKIPYTYYALIDGEVVTSDYFTGEIEKRKELEYAVRFTDVGTGRVTFKVPDVKEGAEITVLDFNGNPADITVDGNTYSVEYYNTPEVPQDFKDVALTIAQTWSLFMTKDLAGSAHGFYTIAKYLNTNSEFYQRAYGWATGVDITFTSPHTLNDPPFQNVVVDNFTVYSPNCFSCHISFTKEMLLTLTGATRYDNTDSTFVFVFADDSDDGVDNPHWALIDMLAN